MKIAVLGSGNGGCAVAFDWAKHGHDVYLFDFEEFSANIDAINENIDTKIIICYNKVVYNCLKKPRERMI